MVDISFQGIWIEMFALRPIQNVKHNCRFVESITGFFQSGTNSSEDFRHQDTKAQSFIIISIYCLCLGGFVAIFSGLSGLDLTESLIATTDTSHQINHTDPIKGINGQNEKSARQSSNDQWMGMG